MTSKWKVTGADRDSGEDRVVWIEAKSLDSAAEQAVRFNMLVADVREERQTATSGVAKSTHHGVQVVELRGGQVKLMATGVWRIATGVFLGLLMWSIFAAVVAVVFWITVLAAAVSAAA